MSMGVLIQAASAIAAVNALLLLLLTGVWVRNFRLFGTELVAGLAAFALVILAENVVALYFFFSMQSLYAGGPRVQRAVLVLRGIQFAGLAVLTYVTMK